MVYIRRATQKLVNILQKWFPDEDIFSASDEHKEVRNRVNMYLQEHSKTIPPPVTDWEMGVIKTISPLKASGCDLIKAIVLQNLYLKTQIS